MKVEVEINDSSNAKSRYLTWAPSPCRIRVTHPAGIPGQIADVRLERRIKAGGGSIEFSQSQNGPYAARLRLALPKNGNSVRFFVRGAFGRPSTEDGDVQIDVTARVQPTISVFKLVGSVPLMVRIRKNARSLTAPEQARFVAAMAQLNNQGLGRFADFRDMHVNQSMDEAHFDAGFLPWHRAYLLDLERELQNIDSSVALPYWRFDQAAPNVFTLDFLGVANATGNVQFSPSNPLQFWRTDSLPGVIRRPLFPVGQAPGGLRTEAQTLGLGTRFVDFTVMEGNPHGSAHTRFGGFISSIGTAARDPLFFLLHCNVDRLWAKWQRANNRFDTTVPDAFHPNNPNNRIGHNLSDSMWPWNGVVGNPRPLLAPGGTLAASPCVVAPGPQPRVGDCFDYEGSVNSLARMGFSYDDVP